MTNRILHSKPTISEHEKETVLTALDSCYVGQGKMVEQVNSRFSTIFKKETSFFVNSGTSAFFLALKGLGVKEADEVILPNYLCGSIYSQIISIKAIPVVIDTSPDSFFVSPEIILKAITPKTKAIVINHPFGHFEPAVLELDCTEIPIIEDVTHSLYARHGNSLAGSIGDVSIVSLGSTKFVTSGTGGIVSFSKKMHALEVEKLLDHDYNKFSGSEGVIRYNFKMGDLNAALLLGQLNHIESIIKKRIEIARNYYSKLNVPSYPSKLIEGSVYFRFFIQCRSVMTDSIQARLKSENIDSAKGGVPLMSKTFSLTQKYSNSEAIWSELLSIPIYPSLGSTELNSVINAINSKK